MLWKTADDVSAPRERDQSEASSGFSSGTDSDIDQLSSVTASLFDSQLIPSAHVMRQEDESSNNDTATDDEKYLLEESEVTKSKDNSAITVGIGACFVHGPMNNPVSLMCHQVCAETKVDLSCLN